MITRNDLALLMRDTIRARYVADDGPVDAAYLTDDDPLDDVMVDGHVDLLALADVILADCGYLTAARATAHKLVTTNGTATVHYQRFHGRDWFSLDPDQGDG